MRILFLFLIRSLGAVKSTYAFAGRYRLAVTDRRAGRRVIPQIHEDDRRRRTPCLSKRVHSRPGARTTMCLNVLNY